MRHHQTGRQLRVPVTKRTPLQPAPDIGAGGYLPAAPRMQRRTRRRTQQPEAGCSVQRSDSESGRTRQGVAGAGGNQIVAHKASKLRLTPPADIRRRARGQPRRGSRHLPQQARRSDGLPDSGSVLPPITVAFSTRGAGEFSATRGANVCASVVRSSRVLRRRARISSRRTAIAHALVRRASVRTWDHKIQRSRASGYQSKRSSECERAQPCAASSVHMRSLVSSPSTLSRKMANVD